MDFTSPHKIGERIDELKKPPHATKGYDHCWVLKNQTGKLELAAKVKEVAAAEVIVLTRPHIVAEFFHLDWTSRARRKLGVPVLHLLEHENFDEQAGGGEGISGF